MKKVNYIVIDESNSYSAVVSKYETEEEMLNAIEHNDLTSIEVWLVDRRLRIMKRPSVVIIDSQEVA